MGTILVAMRDHERHYDLQEHACAALYGLLSEGSLDDSLSLASECGISTLIHALKTIFVESEEERRQHMRQQEQDAQQDDSHQVEKYQQRHLDVYHFGLGALACVSTTRAPNNQELIVLSSGVQVIVGIMTAHPEHPEISQYGSEVLKNLSYSAEYQSAIAVAGGISAILTAMRRHGEYVGIQEFGCCTIRNFSLNDDNQKWIASEGGISTLLVAMTLYPRHSEIQAFGCEVMALLAEDSENQMIFASEHGIEEVCMIIKEHSKDRDVREKGYNVLAQMVEARPELFTLMETGIQTAVSYRITKKETRRRLASMVDWFKVKAISRASLEALGAFSSQDGGDDVDTVPLNHRGVDAMSRLESEAGWSDADDESDSEGPMTGTDQSENGDSCDDQTNEELLGLVSDPAEEAQRSSVSRLVSWITEKKRGSSDRVPDGTGDDDDDENGIEDDGEHVGLLSFDAKGPNAQERDAISERDDAVSSEDPDPQETISAGTSKPTRNALSGMFNNWLRRNSSHSGKGSDADAEGSEGDDTDDSTKGLSPEGTDAQPKDDDDTKVQSTEDAGDTSTLETVAAPAAASDSTTDFRGSAPIFKGPISDSDSVGENIHVFEEEQGDDTDDDSVGSPNSTKVNVHVPVATEAFV